MFGPPTLAASGSAQFSDTLQLITFRDYSTPPRAHHQKEHLKPVLPTAILEEASYSSPALLPTVPVALHPPPCAAISSSASSVRASLLRTKPLLTKHFSRRSAWDLRLCSPVLPPPDPSPQLSAPACSSS
jgi:hypothetical protein